MSRKYWSPDEKLQIILAGLKAEDSIGEICRKFGIHQSQYYRWKKVFLEGGKEALKGNGKISNRELQLLKENNELKSIIGDLTIENRLLKKLQAG